MGGVVEKTWYVEPDEIERLQLARLRQRAIAAGQVPFFRHRWEEAGFDPYAIRSLDDLWRAPSYTVDIRKSIGACTTAWVSGSGQRWCCRALDAWTEVHTSPKPKRFRDER